MMVPMKHTGFFVVAALGWLLVGCSDVVGPDEFLYTFRAGAVSGAPVSPGGAVYAGRDGEFHVLRLRDSGTPSERFLNVSDKDRLLRCRADQLPVDFPRGFSPLTAEAYESSEDTRNYVQAYIQHSLDPTAGRTKRPTEKPIGGNEWSDNR